MPPKGSRRPAALCLGRQRISAGLSQFCEALSIAGMTGAFLLVFFGFVTDGSLDKAIRFLFLRKLRKNPLRLDGGSFPPLMQDEKLEIHKVFLNFPSFCLTKNLSPPALVDFPGASVAETPEKSPAAGFQLLWISPELPKVRKLQKNPLGLDSSSCGFPLSFQRCGNSQNPGASKKRDRKRKGEKL